MIIRKKKTIDGLDREILRTIKTRESGLSGRQIAKKVGLSDSAINPRLHNLKRQGIVKDKCEGVRKFKRKFGEKTRQVRSCSKRTWTIDLR